MRKIVFATHNQHKLEEVRHIIGSHFQVISLTDLGCHQEIPETGTTLQENALIKARFVHQQFGLDCFADDTGLEVEALNGAPGVYSARYAGTPSNDTNNVIKLLQELSQKQSRTAAFKTVIASIINGEESISEGSVCGTIIDECRGEEGFGYDPVFIPNGYTLTFAQMSANEKNAISHRARAVNNFVQLLNIIKL